MESCECFDYQLVESFDSLPGYLLKTRVQEEESCFHREKKKCCKRFKKGKRCGKCPKR